MDLITSLLLFCLVGPDGLGMAQQVLRSQTSARPRHVSLVLSSNPSQPRPIHNPSRPSPYYTRHPGSSTTAHTPPSARVRQGRLHGGGRLHLTVQRLRSPRSEADISGQPSRPLAPLGANRRAMSAPKAAGLGRRSQAAGGGRGEGPRVGQARRRRAAALGAQGRGCAGAGSRAGAVLRIPARVRGHRHRRHRLHLRVHEPAAGVRDHRLRQRPVRAAPGLLRLHRHPDLRVSVVQGCADGEQGGRGARPQRWIPVTSIHLPVQKSSTTSTGILCIG